MTMLRYAIPGIGGSLGECAVCGESFTYEILTGKAAAGLRVSGIDANLPVHEACGELVKNLQGPWAEIRDKFPDGPMRRAFDEETEASKETA